MSQKSKLLALVLRHRPEHIGVFMDTAGWVSISELVQSGFFTEDELTQIVLNDDKDRYCIRNGFIRANQGHSVASVQVELEPFIPTQNLFHGTILRLAKKISSSGGISKMDRNHVHLSCNYEIARAVGARRGSPVVLEIDAPAMHSEGFKFFVSANGVILADHVPKSFIINLDFVIESESKNE